MSLHVETSHPSLENLPDIFIITLNELSAISFKGEEQSKYLQGQVTCDINNATEHELLHGAHCDSKGKVFCVFRLINRLSAHILIQPKASIPASLAELKKFGVFAKVEIEQTDTLSFCALVGDKATALLQKSFTQVPNSLTPVIQIGSTTLVYITGNKTRYLLIDETAILENIMNSFSLPIYQHAVWNLLEITNGFPMISENSVQGYVPQMLNLQAINGISFTKGCYLGQETVARMQYLGKNKRALFTLSTKITSPLESKEVIEKQLGENWRKAGDILMSYQADDSTCYIQAVLTSDIYEEKETSLLRLKLQPNSMLLIQKLPYTSFIK